MFLDHLEGTRVHISVAAAPFLYHVRFSFQQQGTMFFFWIAVFASLRARGSGKRFHDQNAY